MFFSIASSTTYSTRDLQANIEGRQSTLVERYVSEVFLASQGLRADPQETAGQLVSTAAALLNGGQVTAGAGERPTISIGAVTDPVVRIKLGEEQKRVHELVGLGNTVLSLNPSSPQYAAAVNQLEAASHMVANVAYDAVGRSTQDTAAALDTNSKTQQIIALVGIVFALLFSWIVIRSVFGPSPKSSGSTAGWRPAISPAASRSPPPMSSGGWETGSTRCSTVFGPPCTPWVPACWS